MLTVDTRAQTVTAWGETVPCFIGRSGAIEAAAKREGDGATPLGVWAVRAALLRPDRVAAPVTSLPWRWIRPNDGWSDDPADPAYNRPVTLPHPFAAEKLWKDHGTYDVIVVLGHNDAPPVRGMGSAIFLHCWRGRPTAGCVAVDHTVLVRWLAKLTPGNTLAIA